MISSQRRTLWNPNLHFRRIFSIIYLPDYEQANYEQADISNYVALFRIQEH